ncbi:hypothetical protein FQR65_LT00105 [Abscondita terminalis]|nr:hypothetical protein FQR65_LT00105 [Abscondita terminalis]
MTEFITIQVGQCGNQIGSTFWPSVLEEYGFEVNYKNKVSKRRQFLNSNFELSFHSFFSLPTDTKCSNFTTLADLKESKSILVDMEDSVVTNLRTGPLRDFFDDKYTITNYSGSGNNWAEGYCQHGPRYKDAMLRAIQRAVDKCDSLQGFLMLFSVGGGTGSGLGTYILKLLDEYFPEVERFVSCVYPTGTEDVITCPYNMALATNQMIEHANCVFPVENRALSDIISQHKFKNSTIVEYKPFNDMNSLISKMLLHLTSGSRFDGSMNVDINEISTNMVPFPKLHFLSTSVSPVVESFSKNVVQHNSQHVKDEIFRNSYLRNRQLLKIDPLDLKSVLLSVSLIGRGDFSVSDMRNYVNRLQKKGNFTSWSHKAIKVGLCNVPPVNNPSAFLSLFNTTSMRTILLIFWNNIKDYTEKGLTSIITLKYQVLMKGILKNARIVY